MKRCRTFEKRFSFTWRVRIWQRQRQMLTIPHHRELDTGTLRAIFRQASQYIPDEELRPHFYTE